jgi:hypothetical protein
MSDENKQGDAAKSSELTEEDLETVAGGTVINTGGALGPVRRLLRDFNPGGTPSAQMPEAAPAASGGKTT